MRISGRCAKMQRVKGNADLFLVALIVIGFLLVPVATDFLRATNSSRVSASITEEGLEIRNSGAVAQLFGEFRAGISDVMFVKTERYLHSGVGYESHLDHDAMAKSGEVEMDAFGVIEVDESGRVVHKGSEEEDHHDTVATLIRAPGEDWRSFIGDLEREVKPWIDPGEHVKHTSGEELLPWYWLAVTANPHNVRAYRIASFWLMTRDLGNKTEEALRFVNDGIRNNPEAFSLYLSKGEILVREKRYDEALPVFEEGIAVAWRRRPEGGFPSENPSDLRETDFKALLRFRIFMLSTLDRDAEALERIKEFRGFFPEDRTLDNLRARLLRDKQ